MYGHFYFSQEFWREFKGIKNDKFQKLGFFMK